MAADIAFVNGPVFSSNAARSFLDGVAVTRTRISGVGREAREQVGPSTEVVDLDGRLLCPGFQDAHVHPGSGGLKLMRCSLYDAFDAESTLKEVGAYASGHPSEPWIRGGGWSYSFFPAGNPPAELLDRLVPDRPVYLEVRDGHSAWVNGKALEMAGITSRTADPSDGRIERLANGSPQGTLHEGAMDLVERLIPEDTISDREAGMLAGQRYLLSCGITAWQDAIVEPVGHRVYRSLGERGDLSGSVIGALWWERARGLEQVDELVSRSQETAPNYRPTSIKLMLDGVVENHTAAMLAPYLLDPRATEKTGIDFIDPSIVKEAVTRFDRLGLQCHFHAIGDRAVRSALDAVEAARRANSWSDLRHHIAHIQLIHPDDIPRFRRLGVAANAQPLWATHHPEMDDLTIPFLGQERSGWQYPFRSLLAAGATMAMGSDWPVSTANVMAEIEVAVNRVAPETRQRTPFLKDERLTLADALIAFTAGSAFVNHLDDTGTIASGMRADLVVLDRNPFEDPPIGETRVAMTMVGGKLVYEA